MTNHPNPNSAAQAPEPKTVLTADELKASSPFQWLGRRYTPEVAERLLREFESVLLSKLRAPVSDIREGFELTYAADADDPACASDLSHFTNGWQACIASQVRAPVADERATKALNRIERRASDDQRQRDLDDLTVVRDALQSSHVSDERELRAAAQATCDALKTVARFAVESLDDRDALVAASIRLRAALASAPVAGEARHPTSPEVPYGWVCERYVGVSLDGQEMYSTPSFTRERPYSTDRTIVELYAAPQASAEAPKLPGGWQLALNLAIDAIENAAPVDWPVNWPAILHGLKDLRDALSQPQADKDGGQQRAGDVSAEAHRAALLEVERVGIELAGRLHEAAMSLETISQIAGRPGKDMETMDDVRGYAHSRARAARAALSSPQAEQGERDGQD
ncbi:hypothetical protein [Achromobacter insuavis]|uniref:hypothetical protein n=2 Tax=Bacteria TaxID=2 RepID=UPI0029D751AD|nr:hypothetical protein [Achromobacter sp.]MCG2601704.1 hypothetical protein [Achromobacter sp.]